MHPGATSPQQDAVIHSAGQMTAAQLLIRTRDEGSSDHVIMLPYQGQEDFDGREAPYFEEHSGWGLPYAFHDGPTNMPPDSDILRRHKPSLTKRRHAGDDAAAPQLEQEVRKYEIKSFYS